MNWLLEGLMYVLSTVGALLPIVNPLSAVGLVMSITADLTDEERTDQIRRACIYMFCILTAFLVAGGLIMNFFGISIPGLRIAGGMIVSYLGFRMLFPDTAAISMQERAEAVRRGDVVEIERDVTARPVVDRVERSAPERAAGRKRPRDLSHETAKEDGHRRRDRQVDADRKR